MVVLDTGQNELLSASTPELLELPHPAKVLDGVGQL